MNFEEAVEVVNQRMHSHLVDNDTKLMLYGYYKVATVTEAPVQKSFSIVDSHKYKKWKEYYEKYSQTDAQKRYVALVKLLIQKRSSS